MLRFRKEDGVGGGLEYEKSAGKWQIKAFPIKENQMWFGKAFAGNFSVFSPPSSHITSSNRSIRSFSRWRDKWNCPTNKKKILQIKFPITMQFHYYTRLLFCVVFRISMKETKHTHARALDFDFSSPLVRVASKEEKSKWNLLSSTWWLRWLLIAGVLSAITFTSLWCRCHAGRVRSIL